MNIYVGNLPYSMGDAELRQLFEEFGAVSSASVVKDKFTGRSRGFGFVEMADGGEASRAIESTNGRSLAGRGLVVNEARPREERPRGNWGGGGGGGRDRY
jgi:RNA recognition motif-containing protein